MNQIIKQKWLDALRSGQYEQTRANLRNKHGFCCLGVLCDLYVKEYTDVNWVYQDSRYQLINNKATLPYEVREWAKLKESNPLVKSGDGLTSLAELNDGGKTFNEIAQVIEEQL